MEKQAQQNLSMPIKLQKFVSSPTYHDVVDYSSLRNRRRQEVNVGPGKFGKKNKCKDWRLEMKTKVYPRFLIEKI